MQVKDLHGHQTADGDKSQEKAAEGDLSQV